jgi:hypothetical protein
MDILLDEFLLTSQKFTTFIKKVNDFFWRMGPMRARSPQRPEIAMAAAVVAAANSPPKQLFETERNNEYKNIKSQ